MPDPTVTAQPAMSDPTPTAEPAADPTGTPHPSSTASSGNDGDADAEATATATPEATARPTARATSTPSTRASSGAAAPTLRPQATPKATELPKPKATASPKPTAAAAPTKATPTPPRIVTATPTVPPPAAAVPTSTPIPTATSRPTRAPAVVQATATVDATPIGGGSGLQPEGVNGPNPSGPRSIPVTTGIGVAMGGGIFDLTDAELFEQFKTLADGGVTWVRVDIDWSWIERNRGTFDWEDTDLIVDAARFEGLEVIGLIAYTPSWARPAGTTDKHPPINRGDFASFAGRVSARYRSQVTHWEVWNEPNHRPFWESGADPISYGDLLAVSAASIKQANPNAFVISGGMSPAVDADGSLSPETFMAGFMPRVPDRLLDGVGIHPYSFPALPSDSSLPWNTFGRMPAMKTLAQSYDPGVELWSTEFGAPTDVVSRTVQADHIRDAINCIDKWSWAGPIMLFTYQDYGATDAFGLFTSSGSPKPAWQTVTDLALLGSDPASCNL